MENIRNTPEWNNIFKLLQNAKYASKIIDAVVPIKNVLKLTQDESKCVHEAYDNRILFQALGFDIKGEDTKGIRDFTDIIFKYLDILVIYLSKEIIDSIYNGNIDS